ncbi:MAG TPA: redoxin domain-containing protein, partial [Burkholderiaceae bacterium]|nr:redoxin domain-containing protein [Burkholderiaceae bacterium]
MKNMKSLAILLLSGLSVFAADVQVFLFARTDCPATNQYAPEFRRIVEEFQGKHVAFYLVYPDPNENNRAIENHMAQFGLPGTPLRDPDKELQKRTHATVTPEVAVFDAAGNLKYHGSTDALEGALTGHAVVEKKATGCSLENFNNDIAPIIYKHCSSCHRPGET